jgi:hypothetical protein
MMPTLPDSVRSVGARLGALAARAWARLRRGHLPALAVLAVVHFAVFARLLKKREDGALYEHIPWDFQDSYHRYLVYISDCLRSHQLPIWYPYGGAGSPFFVNPQSQMWSPVTWIVSAVFGYTHHVAQRQLVWTTLVGGFGAYLLAYDVWRDGGRRAALVGGIVFMLTGAVITNFEHLDIVNAAALTPWLFLTLRRVLLDGFKAVPGFAVVVALMLASGYPGVVIMLALWAVAAAIYLVVVEVPPAERRRALAALVAGGCLGLLATAGHWLPIAAHRAEFTRGKALDLGASLAHGLRLIDLAGLVFPSLPVSPAPGSTLDVSMRGLYVGVVGLPLAVVCLWRREGRPVGIVAGAAVAALLLATAAAFFGRITLNLMLPFLRFSRLAAADSRGLAGLWISLLMAGGAATVASRDDARGDSRAFLVRAYLVALVALPLGLALLKLTIFSDSTGAKFGNEMATYTVAQMLFVAAAAVIARRAASGAAAIRGVAVLLAIDLGTGVLACYATVGQPITAEQQTLRQGEYLSTFAAPAPNEQRLVVSSNLGDAAGNVGYTSKRFYLNHYGPFQLKAFDKLIADGFQKFVTSGQRVVGLPATAVSAAGGADPADGAAFERAAQPVDFHFTDYGSSHVDLDVKVARDTWLVMNELYFPGWSASIDGGRWVRMVAVSGGLRAVRVGPGAHHVATRFRPRSFVVGAILTACGWLAIIAWAILMARRRLSRRRISGS